METQTKRSGTVSAKTQEIANAVVASLQRTGINDSDLSDLIALAQSAIFDDGDRDWGLQVTGYVKKCKEQFYSGVRDAFFEDDVFWDAVLLEAQSRVVDSYFLYLEKNREFEEQFYLPRRTMFLKHGITQAFQDILDDKLDILCISGVPGLGKTTSEKFFNSGIIGWFPNDYNLFYSHSGDITRMYYDGVLQILTDEQEYTWHDIFPGLQVTSTNAKAQSLNVGKYKPFASLQTASVGSENAGKVRASKFLLIDDMIGKLEEALNKNILDKLWAAYSVDARQRKTKDTNGKFCKEIHIATRWSVHDVIGRLERIYEDSDRVRFLRIPDIDPETGESNYLYEVGGFTVEDFNDQALLMDDISYRCLYKQEPVEREGLLYPVDSLRRYLDLPQEAYFKPVFDENGEEIGTERCLRNKEPDAILGICDTKGKGTDYLFLPCFYQYGDDYYLVACICNDEADYEIQYGRMVGLITEYNMQQCQYESNRDGDRVAAEVSKRLKERNARCNITTKYATGTAKGSKETKIIVNADWIKKHVLFKDKSLYTPKEDYGVMMSFLTSHTVTGKNKVDDVPDGLASFALYVTNGQPVVAKIVNSLF